MIGKAFNIVLAFILCASGLMGHSAKQAEPVGISFEKKTLFRSHGRGDNWCMTWLEDDSVLTVMCDGNWMGKQDSYHNRLYKIQGEADDFEIEELMGYPRFLWRTDSSWFGFGTIAVDDTIYVTLSKTPDEWWSGPFRGFKLLKSEDNGASWMRVNRIGETKTLGLTDEARNVVNMEEMFFLEESGRPRQERIAYPFSYVAFVQEGRAHGATQDAYVYIYSPEGAAAHQLMLARAPRNRLGVRKEWEYFTGFSGGSPTWTPDLEKRQPAHVFPEKSSRGEYYGWYSWLPSVVWNEGLQLYIMVNSGTYAGKGLSNSDEDYYDGSMHTRTGSLGFWYSKNPYGPWKRFFYDEYWTVDNPGNRTYQPKLSPKWISADGTRMVLVWSDAMRDIFGKSHRENYLWNQMQVRIELGHAPD